MSQGDSGSQNHTVPVTIAIASQDGSRMFFSIRPHIKLSKLLHSYCQRKQLEFETLRFLYEGKRVSPRHTVRSLHVTDGDEIAVFETNIGGG